MFVSFSWCWSKFVKDPERYSSYSMLWHLKWVVENLRQDAIYSIAQLEQLFALFKEYLQKAATPYVPTMGLYAPSLDHRGKGRSG